MFINRVVRIMEAGLTPEAIMAEAINWEAPAYTIKDIRNISKVDSP
jgi:hypothetical protein